MISDPGPSPMKQKLFHCCLPINIQWIFQKNNSVQKSHLGQTIQLVLQLLAPYLPLLTAQCISLKKKAGDYSRQCLAHSLAVWTLCWEADNAYSTSVWMSGLRICFPFWGQVLHPLPIMHAYGRRAILLPNLKSHGFFPNLGFRYSWCYICTQVILFHPGAYKARMWISEHGQKAA